VDQERTGSLDRKSTGTKFRPVNLVLYNGKTRTGHRPELAVSKFPNEEGRGPEEGKKNDEVDAGNLREQLRAASC